MAGVNAAGAAGIAPDDHPVLETASRTLVMIGLMAGTMMQILDTTIANVALPHMQASLGASQDSISWVLTSYIVALAIATPLTGWLADRIGARRLMIVSIASFMIASMLCGIAANLTQMVLFRVAQGIAGAFIGPLAQAFLLDINRPSYHMRALSIFSVVVMVGPVIGPIIGGILTESLDWRWVFYINVPIGIVCLALLIPLLPDKPRGDRSFDGLGFAMLAVAIGTFQLALDRGEHKEWLQSTEILCEFGIALAASWMFGVHLATSRGALFDPRLIGDRNLVTGSLFMGMIGVVMMSSLALLPSMLQSLYGYDVVDTGLILMSRGIGSVIAMSCTGWLMRRFGPRVLVLTGLAMTSFSLWQMTQWSLEMEMTPVIVSGVIQGLGIGIVLLPLNIMSFATLPQYLRTDGAAIFSLMRNIGSSVGIAIATSQLARNMQVSHADLSQHLTAARLPLDPSLLQMLGDAGAGVLAMLNGEVSRQAAMIAYIDDFKLMMIACLLTLPLILLLRTPKVVRPADLVHISE